MLPHVSGSYYTLPTTPLPSINGTFLNLNIAHLHPFFVPISGDYDQIGLRQSGAGACNYRFAIYGPFTGDLANLPLLLDSGQVASAGIGDRLATIAQTLAAGWYFLAVNTDVGRQVQALNLDDINTPQGQLDLTTFPTNVWYSVALAYGAYPATLSLTNPQSSLPPCIYLRKA